MKQKIEEYIDKEFESIGLSRNGGWADGLGCGDLEDIIRDSIKFGMSLEREQCSESIRRIFNSINEYLSRCD